MSELVQSPSEDAETPCGHSSSDTCDTVSLDEEDVFHILQVQRRRDVLWFLELSDTAEVPLGTLAEQLAAWENKKTIAEVISKERQRVYITLYQNHLPKLDENGLIEYNSDRGKIKRGRHTDKIEYYLHGPIGVTRELDPGLQNEPEPTNDSTDSSSSDESGMALFSLPLPF